LAALGAPATAVEVPPIAIEGRKGTPLVTFPGDEVVFRYRLPEPAASQELFLRTRGYYLEWLRREWLAEESALRAAAFFLDPEGAARRLAPRFKEEEDRIEKLFWSSRYAPR